MAAKKKTALKKKVGSARRGKSAKQTKGETVEVNPAQGLLIGNMPPVKDLLYHADQIAGYQAKAKTAQGHVTAAKKRAREAGVDLNSIATALGYERTEPLELATHLRQLAALMAEKGMPVQIQLFEPKHGSVKEQAAAEGWAAGKAGRTPDTTRWPEGAEGHVEYMRRWNDGQKEIISGKATGEEGEE